MNLHMTHEPAQPHSHSSKERHAMNNHQEQTPPAFSQPYVIDTEADKTWVQQEYGASTAEAPPNLTPEQVLRVMELFAEIAELEQMIRARPRHHTQRPRPDTGTPSPHPTPDELGRPRAS